MLEALNFVLGAVSDKDIVPALTHVHVEDGYIQAYDGRVMMQAPVPELEGMTFTVPAERLKRAVEACEGEPKISVKERVTVSRGRFKAMMSQIEGFPKQEIPPKSGHSLKGLMPVLKALRPLVSEDASRLWSLGIMIDGEGHAWATNNVILARAAFDFPEPITIPVFAVDEILRVGEEPELVLSEANSLTFYYKNGRILKSQLIAGDGWPAIGPMFEAVEKEGAVEIPTDLYSICETLSKMVTDAKLPILRIAPEGVSTGEGEHLAEYELPVGVEGLYDWRMLKLVLGAADHWLVGDKGYFRGPLVEGIFVGRRS
jgi:hypothetical protein